MTKLCSIEDCSNKTVARGWCPKHYQRWQKHGSPNTVAWERQESRDSCAVVGCEGAYLSQGFCNKHYIRKLKFGDPRATSQPDGMEAKFWLRVPEERSDNECWDWLGSISRLGYGVFPPYKGKTYLAHRISFSLHQNRELAKYEQIHHICANRKCVNPKHLQSVSAKENIAEMQQRQYYIQHIKYLEELLTENGIEY